MNILLIRTKLNLQAFLTMKLKNVKRLALRRVIGETGTRLRKTAIYLSSRFRTFLDVLFQPIKIAILMHSKQFSRKKNSGPNFTLVS